jgi:UTP--glucose-1-phosphate uridylyltransferase
MLRAKDKDAQADMIHSIFPTGIEGLFVRQAEQLGLGHMVLNAERAVSVEPFAMLLTDDFLMDYEPGATADLTQAFASSGKSQLSVTEVDGPDISKYGVVVPNECRFGYRGVSRKTKCERGTLKLCHYRMQDIDT